MHAPYPNSSITVFDVSRMAIFLLLDFMQDDSLIYISFVLYARL